MDALNDLNPQSDAVHGHLQNDVNAVHDHHHGEDEPGDHRHDADDKGDRHGHCVVHGRHDHHDAGLVGHGPNDHHDRHAHCARDAQLSPRDAHPVATTRYLVVCSRPEDRKPSERSLHVCAGYQRPMRPQLHLHLHVPYGPSDVGIRLGYLEDQSAQHM